ncbi:MAG: glycoside hydrolase family 88 protein [Rikenellaceae bacterium]|nr:glycoside hydrolase family 88 protein [Rikenellaceae bacterium]
MMRRLLVIGLLAACMGCTSQKSLLTEGARPLSLRMVESEIARTPRAVNLDGVPEGRVKWNYTTGLELLAIMDAAREHDRPDFYDYALGYYDTMIRPDGSILTYSKAKYNLDHICPGRPLFEIYARTGQKRFLRAMDTLYSQLKEQPRTPEGGYWHKQVYPNQMWMDGLYMAEPFHAEYLNRFVLTRSPELTKELQRKIVDQFTIIARYTYDPDTELFRHAWDSSHEMFWCDKQTGQSQHAWGRGLGWYTVALVETLELLGEGAEGADELKQLLGHIMKTLPRYADPETGMWYQVLDCPGREGNYLEATCSIMFIYAQLKGARLGYLPEEEYVRGMKNYERFVERFVRENEDRTISLIDCCAVGGLGGKQMRDGSFEYYLSEPIIENDCKGVGPFIWASMEYERARREGR